MKQSKLGKSTFLPKVIDKKEGILSLPPSVINSEINNNIPIENLSSLIRIPTVDQSSTSINKNYTPPLPSIHRIKANALSKSQHTTNQKFPTNPIVRDTTNSSQNVEPFYNTNEIQSQRFPTQSQGFPTQSQGVPTQSQGFLTQSQGFPTQSQGFPVPSQGFQSQGITNQFQNFPGASFATSSASRGTSRENMLSQTATKSQGIINNSNIFIPPGSAFMSKLAYPKLELQKHQIESFNYIKDHILKDNFYYIDGSGMGRGKTFIALCLAIILNLKIFVVCPSIAISVWTTEIEKYGVSSNLCKDGNSLAGVKNGKPCVMTYETFTSTKNHQPKHGLFTRNEENSLKERFTATDLLSKIITEGTLFIFDEAQNCLSETANHFHAVKCITDAVRARFEIGRWMSTNKSRVGLLSGTMIDQPKFCVALCKLLGYISTSNMTAVNQLKEISRKMNPVDFQIFLNNNPFLDSRNPDKIQEYILTMFVDVIRPKVMSIMPEDTGENKTYTKDVKDIYLPMTEEEQKYYTDSIFELYFHLSKNFKKVQREIAELNIDIEGITNLNSNSETSLGKVIQAIRSIQMSKANSILRAVDQILTSRYFDAVTGQELFPKIALYASYYEVIDYYKNVLAPYHPIEITGRINQSNRDIGISHFQEDNNNYRVIISNIKVGSVGISLNDKHGTRPRIAFINPDYWVKALQQTTGRFARYGTIGTAVIRVAYGNVGGVQEVPIAKVVMSKGKHMKKFHKEQGILFPGEYPSEIYKYVQAIKIPQWNVYDKNGTSVPEPEIKMLDFAKSSLSTFITDLVTDEKKNYLDSILPTESSLIVDGKVIDSERIITPSRTENVLNNIPISQNQQIPQISVDQLVSMFESIS